MATYQLSGDLPAGRTDPWQGGDLPAGRIGSWLGGGLPAGNMDAEPGSDPRPGVGLGDRSKVQAVPGKPAQTEPEP